MKIKDCQQEFRTRKVKIPGEYHHQAIMAGLMPPFEGFIFSQWAKGVWIKTDLSSSKIYPITIGNLSDVLEWDIVEQA